MNWVTRQLQANGSHLDRIDALRVEASNRCFYRINTDTAKLVLMTSPPALERNEQFVALAELFAAHALPVPKVVASNFEEGWFLMSDLGRVHLEEAYATGAREPSIKAAIDTLAILGEVRDPRIEPYDADRLNMELAIFTEWFVGNLLQQNALVGTTERPFAALVEAAEAQPRSCVHRDYHCRNLLYNDGALGIVDFQDALHGPVLYDLASLLRDCYYTFDENEIDQWLNYFVALTPSLSGQRPATIKRWFDFTAIQRQLKAIGIFARLHLRDAKSSHLTHIRPVLAGLIQLTGNYPELQPLSMQLSRCAKPATQALNALGIDT